MSHLIKIYAFCKFSYFVVFKDLITNVAACKCIFILFLLQGCNIQQLTTWLVCQTPRLVFPNDNITVTSPKEVQYGFYLDGVMKFHNISESPDFGPILYYPDPVIEQLPPKGDNAKKYKNGDVLVIKVSKVLDF